jgi:hypothetical protein
VRWCCVSSQRAFSLLTDGIALLTLLHQAVRWWCDSLQKCRESAGYSKPGCSVDITALFISKRNNVETSRISFNPHSLCATETWSRRLLKRHGNTVTFDRALTQKMFDLLQHHEISFIFPTRDNIEKHLLSLDWPHDMWIVDSMLTLNTRESTQRGKIFKILNLWSLWRTKSNSIGFMVVFACELKTNTTLPSTARVRPSAFLYKELSSWTRRLAQWDQSWSRKCVGWESFVVLSSREWSITNRNHPKMRGWKHPRKTTQLQRRSKSVQANGRTVPHGICLSWFETVDTCGDATNSWTSFWQIPQKFESILIRSVELLQQITLICLWLLRYENDQNRFALLRSGEMERDSKSPEQDH